MGALLYYISFPFIYLISLLPFRALYFLSDLFYVLVYKLIGYRRKVTINNLRKSFPDKPEKEIKDIGRTFYHYLCDLALEIIKTLTISPADVDKHIRFEDTALIERFKSENRSIIIVLGHFGNWELGGPAFSLKKLHTLYVIYHPLSNKHFDKLFYHMRTRLGTKLYSMNNTLRGMISNKSHLTATGFIADQTPFAESAYWTTFLNQDTPFFTGAEKLAVKFNYPVVYISIDRVRRGLYSMRSELISENSAETKENEITESFARRLEEDILRKPEIWLWSHRRWKHKRNG